MVRQAHHERRSEDFEKAPHAYEDALKLRHAGLMDLTGRPMKGWALVESEGLKSDDDLAAWLNLGLAFVATLPPK